MAETGKRPARPDKCPVSKKKTTLCFGIGVNDQKLA